MLNEIFMTVPDHGVTGRCSYALSGLLTYICGGEDYVNMSELSFDVSAIGDKETATRPENDCGDNLNG